MKTWIPLVAACCLPSIALGTDELDLAVAHRIRVQAFDHSEVAKHLFYLADVFGPRLTNSRGFRAAGEWAVKELAKYGIRGWMEEWGPYRPSWENTHFEGHLIEPQYAPLIGFPLAWTPGTDGTIAGEPILAVLGNESDLKAFTGKLRGRIVLVSPPRGFSPELNPAFRRLTPADLAKEVLIPDPNSKSYLRPGRDFRASAQNKPAGVGYPDFGKQRREFIAAEHPALVIEQSRLGDGGTVFGGGVPRSKEPSAPATIVLAAEHYGRIARLLTHHVPVKVQFNIQSRFITSLESTFNVLAQIDGVRSDEIVLMGAHLDSWTGGTGATDNAAGCAILMEAMRILKAAKVDLRRTVRMGLWAAEEEGLLGSRAYVQKHFGDSRSGEFLPEQKKVSAYFNLDNGAGRIRGIYLQDNDMLRPVFQSWLEPFRDLEATAVTVRSNFGSDLYPFDSVGIPSFTFIQDPLDYTTRTHHSNMDLYERAPEGDMMQASAVLAWFIYKSANREEMLPRER